MRIPGIYVDIKGDITQLDADMRKARALVRESASGMSNALNNALKPGQISSNINSLVRNLGTLKRTSELTGKEFDNISVDLGKLNKHIGLSEKEFGKLQQRMLQNRASQQADRALKSIARSANLSGKEMVMLRHKLGDNVGAMREFGRVGVTHLENVRARVFSLQTAMAAAGVGMGLQYSVNAFAEMDKGLIAVQKTTNLTDSEVQQLGADLQQITTELPLTTKELLSIAQSAGQLGIQGSSNILKFTRTVGMLGTASDLHGEEAATALARLMNVTGESAEQVDVLGSVIVALGNDMATTESEIALMATEVGQATSQFHVSSAEASALGAALRVLGVKAELGGSAVGRVFRAIDASIRGGGESLKYLEEMTGQTAEQLRKSFSVNATSVFQSFIEGLGDVVKSGGSAGDALEVFGLKGEEILKVIPTLALRSEKLGKALGIAAEEQQNATALTQEALKAASSFSAQMTIVSNEVDIAAAAIGRELAPHVLEAAQAFGEFAESNAGDFADWVKDTADGARELAPLVSGIGDEAGYLFNAFTDLPVELQAAGLIPALLFGKKGVVGALAALHAGEAIFNMGQGLAAVSAGHISWDEFSSMDANELQNRLDSLKKNASNINKLRIAQKKDAQVMAQGGRFYVGNSGVFGENLSSLAESPFVGPRRPAQNVSKSSFSTSIPSASSSAQKKADKKRLSAQKSFNSAYNKLALKPYDFERKQIEFQRVAWEKSGVNHVQLVEWETLALTELDDKYQQEKERKLSSFNSAYNKLALKPYDFERKQIEFQRVAWEKSGVNHVQLVEWETLALTELDDKYQQEKERKLSSFNSAYNKAFLSPYILERKAIKEQARVWKEDGADRVRVNQWLTSELAKQDREYSAKAKAEAKKRAEEAKQEARAKLEVSNDFFKGLKAGFRDAYEEQETWAERGIDLAHDFATSSKAAFSDFGVDLMKGQLDSFSSYYETFLSGLRRSLADHMADLVVNKGMGMLVQYAGSMFDYGSAATSFLGNIFHTGNMRLSADEVAAILQEGEMVIPAKQAEVIRQSVGSEGMSKASFFDHVVDRVNVGDQSMFSMGNNAQKDVYGQLMLESTLSAAGVGALNAMNNWMAVGSAVGRLESAGVNVDRGAADRLQWNSALGGMVGSFFPSFAGNMFGSFANQAMGLNDEKYSLLGLDFTSADVGGLLGSAALAFVGGPAAPVLSGILSPAFSLAVSGVADLFDLRDNEVLRDVLEDDLGFIGGRVAFSAYRDRIASVMDMPNTYAWGYEYESGIHTGLSHTVANDLSWLTNQNLTPLEILDLIKLDIKKGKSAAAKGAQARVSYMYHTYGDAYAQQAWDDEVEGQMLARDIMKSPEFASFDSRAKAARKLHSGFECGNYYYTAAGEKVSKESIFNPNSAAYAALGPQWAAAVNAGLVATNYSLGDAGGLGAYENYSGLNFGSWINDHVDFAARMQAYAESLGGNTPSGAYSGNDFEGRTPSSARGGRDGSAKGMGRDSSQGGSGVGAAGTGSHGTGLRRQGGSVEAHKPYVWQENVPGLSGEIFMPKTDGYVMKHEDTRDFINALNAVVGQQKGGESSGGEGMTLVVNLNVDDQQLAQAVIPGLKEASKNGVQTVYADTLITER